MSYSIAIVEDNLELSNLLKILLNKAGFETYLFNNGDEFLDIYLKINIDLILLDLQLPTISGIEICKILKSNLIYRQKPIIALTARDNEFDIVNGLNIGFDDYITKPFSQNILLARVKAALRKYDYLNDAEKINIEGLEINEDSLQVFVDGIDSNLSSHEFKTLLYLINNKNKVLSREQILEATNEHSDNVGDRAIDTVIAKIRKKLKSYAKLIVSVYGAGYMFRCK